MDKEKQKEYFIHLLQSTNRKGVDNVILELEKSGFFEAPASSRFHLNRAGGLLEHSLNVGRMALKLREVVIREIPDIQNSLPEDSVIIAALLHDVCKADIYKKVIKYKQNELGKWDEVPGYDVDYTFLPLGHGEKSVIRLLQWGLAMTDEEILAIRWHMSAWDLPFQSVESKSNFNEAKNKTPLLGLIISADGLSANVLERE